jgi:hypothetical protein
MNVSVLVVFGDPIAVYHLAFPSNEGQRNAVAVHGGQQSTAMPIDARANISRSQEKSDSTLVFQSPFLNPPDLPRASVCRPYC